MTQDTPEATLQSAAPLGGVGVLRNRLVAASAVITALAVAAMGYYIFYRSQQSTASLADQLETRVREQARASLEATSTEQVNVLNAFFQAMSRDVTDAGASAAELLSQQSGLSTGQYWNATASMVKLPTGSWDNPSAAEPASVFIPVQANFDEALAAELNTLKYLDFVVPGKLKANPDAVAVYFGGRSGETLYYPNIDLANIVPADFDVTKRPWYIKAEPAQDPEAKAVWSDPYLDAALHGLVVTTSVPVKDATGAFRGVLAMDVQLGRISEIVSNINMGKTGYAFLVDGSKRLIAMPDAGYADLGLTTEQAPLGQALDDPAIAGVLPEAVRDLVGRMASGEKGLETLLVGGSERFALYQPVPEVGYSMVVLVPTQEMLSAEVAARQQLMASSASTTQFSLVLVVVILLLAALAAAVLGNTLTTPLAALTQTAKEITAGNLDARAPIRSRDEIGILARTLNSMADNFQGLVQSLEQRVRDRTSALAVASEDANRRASQFEAVTRVTRAIGAIRNVSELMPLVTDVISQTFGYYHVGIFLNDEATQNAYLIAANSEGGRRMLGRHHSLRIGEQGIVGYVAARGETRVARNVGEDIVFFNNPDLPATKSEAALPLRSASRIIGVLDVQSTKEDAFLADDLRVLEVLADQVGLAIENTRLFETTQRSLTETETLYRQYVRDAWRRFQPAERITGFRFTPRGSMPLGLTPPSEEGRASAIRDVSTQPLGLTVPIELRGEAIGELVIQGTKKSDLSQDQIDLIQAVAERVALSVENARLFDETSRRAARERLVTEITSKIRSVNDPQEMMNMALEELRTALGATKVQIVPQTIPDKSDDDGHPDPVPPPSA